MSENNNGELVGHKLIETMCKYAKAGEDVNVGLKILERARPVLKRIIEDEKKIYIKKDYIK